MPDDINNRITVLQNIAFLFLVLLILSLPSQETPKLLFWGSFVATSLIILVLNSRVLKREWDAFDSLIIFWMFSGFVVAFFAGIEHKEWGGSTDLVIFTSILLILKKLKFHYKQIDILYNTILLSCLLVSLLALWQKLILHNNESIEFHSVGHVNHTAIYLSLSLVAVIAMLFSKWATASTLRRIFLLAIYCALAITLVLTDSRAAIIAIFLFILVCTLMFRRHILLSITMLTLLVTFSAGNYLLGGGGVINKQLDQVERGIFFEARIKIWRSAILAWKQYPAFGVGIKNYDQVTLDELLRWCAEKSDNCQPDAYLPYAHGHSLYINTLTERGLFGLLVVLVNIIALSYLVYQYRPGPLACDDYKMIWLGAFGAILINIVIGLFNTTLHHENALLSVILIGLYLGKIDYPNESS